MKANDIAPLSQAYSLPDFQQTINIPQA